MDFPVSPTVGQMYTAPSGVTYRWDGYAWTVGFYDSTSQQLTNVGNIIAQVRTLIQDTDNSSGQYRYSTDSLVTALNQCMMELYRIRPDLFLEVGYVVPIFNVGRLDVDLGIEAQYVPPVIYYVVGLVQVRDDEQNQDGRALSFLKVFQNAVVNGGLAA